MPTEKKKTTPFRPSEWAMKKIRDYRAKMPHPRSGRGPSLPQAVDAMIEELEALKKNANKT